MTRTLFKFISVSFRYFKTFCCSYHATIKKEDNIDILIIEDVLSEQKLQAGQLDINVHDNS